MTAVKRLSLALAFVCAALLTTVPAQTAPIEVSADSGRALFSVGGEVAHVRVEVSAPSGEVVYDSGEVAASQVEWPMTDEAGRRVAPGTYLATITALDGAGRRRRRIEQLEQRLKVLKGLLIQKSQPSRGVTP